MGALQILKDLLNEYIERNRSSTSPLEITGEVMKSLTEQALVKFNQLQQDNDESQARKKFKR